MGDSKSEVLYLGDTSLDTAAGYLGGLMKLWKIPFDYVPSHQPFEKNDLAHRLFIISDYSATNMAPPAQQAIINAVHDGAGLLMIGGWESYCGLNGNWPATIVAVALPVQISADDDRVNCDQPALPRKRLDHPIIDALPWETRPPTIGGFNRVIAKPSAQVVLEIARFAARRSDDNIILESKSRDPLLVVGQHGRGRVAALTTDLAPHWVGGLVDWGDARVTASATPGNSIEVGDLYAKFVHQLLHWTGSF